MKYLILLSVFLTGCVTIPLPQSEATKIDLRVHWREPHQIKELASTYGDKAQIVMGYSMYYGGKDNRVCEIFVPKPNGQNDYKWLTNLGHEILHCTDGDYHP